jgi:hypothetical protein
MRALRQTLEVRGTKCEKWVRYQLLVKLENTVSEITYRMGLTSVVHLVNGLAENGYCGNCAFTVKNTDITRLGRGHLN